MLAIPTNVPVVPNPTLTVANPIRLSSIFATKIFCWFVKIVTIPTLLLTTIPLPLLGEYVSSSPVFKLWFLMYIDFVGIKIWDVPVPGFVKNIVIPIPTPEIVPRPIDSTGLKYISLFFLYRYLVLNPAYIENIRESWYKTVVTVCAVPTVPSISLNTLILDKWGSMFKILTFSLPKLKISFSLKFESFPVTLK